MGPEPTIQRLVVDFLDLHAPVAHAPQAILEGLKLDQKHLGAVRAALKRALVRIQVVHEGYGRWRSAAVEPRGECRCPSCHRKGLRKCVEVTIEAPVQCRALDKHGIRSPEVTVVAVNWERERFVCRKCGWSSRRKRGLI